MWFLDGFQLERHSPLAQQRLIVTPQWLIADITNQCESEQALDVSAGTLLSTGLHSFNPIMGRLELVAEKTDISENRASRNFDLMIIKWRLLKITLQAPNEQSSSKAGPKVVPLAVKTATSRQELELLFTISYSNNLRTTGSRKRIVYVSVRLPLTVREEVL
ncbi:hypothetical protein Tco_0097442 [Tanacetum coccineum]